MASSSFIAAKTSDSRVFTQSRGESPQFQACLTLGSVTQSFGDDTPVFCPDPAKRGKFVTVATIEGTEEDVTSSITGRFPLNLRSLLIQLARTKERVTIHCQFGTPTYNPSVFSAYTKSIIFNAARITNYNSDALGSPSEQAEINETGDFSAPEWYEVLPLSWAPAGNSLFPANVAGAVGAVAVIAAKNTFVAFSTYDATAKAGIVYSKDNGTTWAWKQLSTATADFTAAAFFNTIACGSDGTNLHTIDLSGDVTTTNWSTIVKASDVLASGLSYLYGGGASGVLWRTQDPQGSVEDLTSPVAGDVTALDARDNLVIVGGSTGEVSISTDSGTTFSSVVTPGGANSVDFVAVVDDEAFVAGINGLLYITYNSGSTWASAGFSGSGTGTGIDAFFPVDAVGFMWDTNGLFTSTAGGVGGTWVRSPISGTAVTIDTPGNISGAQGEPNILMAVGDDSAGSGNHIWIGRGQ